MSMDIHTLARCKKCDCVFLWYLKGTPFVDAEIIGTCDKCLNEEEHVCIDERDGRPY
jgi:hypothetical protein